MNSNQISICPGETESLDDDLNDVVYIKFPPNTIVRNADAQIEMKLDRLLRGAKYHGTLS